MLYFIKDDTTLVYFIESPQFVYLFKSFVSKILKVQKFSSWTAQNNRNIEENFIFDDASCYFARTKIFKFVPFLFLSIAIFITVYM